MTSEEPDEAFLKKTQDMERILMNMKKELGIKREEFIFDPVPQEKASSPPPDQNQKTDNKEEVPDKATAPKTPVPDTSLKEKKRVKELKEDDKDKVKEKKDLNVDKNKIKQPEVDKMKEKPPPKKQAVEAMEDTAEIVKNSKDKGNNKQ